MGADLITSGIFMIGNKDMVKREDAMQKALKKMSKDGDVWDEFKERTGYEEEDEETEGDIKSYAKDAIGEFMNCFGGRDVAEYTLLPKITLVLSGGMSWGDDPTDSFGAIEKFAALPDEILEAGGFANTIDSYDAFMFEYKKKLTDKLLNDLEKWNTARHI